MKYLIYTRVSPKGSDWIGSETTVVDQATQCRAYVLATDPEGEVVGVIEDEFESGGSSKRPGWQKILKSVKDGTAQWDVLVVRHLDRFSRSIADAVNALELLHNTGKYLIATAQGLNSSNPSGRGVINILLSIAQMEREFAGERTKMKLVSIAAKGLWPVGRPPYGYKRGEKHDNKLYIDDEKAETVRRIFRRYKAGTGSRDLANMFDLPKNTVLYILRNRMYLGVVIYAGKEYKGRHKAIITPKLFNEVQRLVPANTRAPRPQAQKHVYLLSGLATCECGRALTPASAYGRKSKRYNYYKCTDPKCKKTFKAEELEQLVIDCISKIRISKKDIEIIIQEIKKQAEAKIDTGDRKSLLKDIDETRGRKEKITNMFVEGLITPDNAPLMNQKLSQSTTELNNLTGQLAALDAVNATSTDEIDEMAEFVRKFNTMGNVIESATSREELRLNVQTAVHSLKSKDGQEWELTLNLPGSPNCTNWLLRLGSNQQPSD